MNELQWRLNLYAPTGAFLRSILRDQTAILSDGFRLQLTPDGDCREIAFRARGSPSTDRPTWGITPLMAVQLEYLFGGVYIPLSYGQVRQGGNQQDLNGESYTLRSLALKLKFVTLPEGFSAPQQAAHLTVRAVMQAVINSGQLGTPSLILYDDSLIPDLGFDCREIANANQQDPWALLEQIQQDGLGLGVTVAFGVRADRTFYCKPARSDVLTLSDAETRRIVWKAPVAETPYTGVLWYLGKRSDGSPLTHLSLSPEKDTYGYFILKRAVDAGVLAYELGTFDAVANDGTGEVVLNAAQREAFTNGAAGATVLDISAETDSGNVSMTQTLTNGAVRYTMEVTWVNGDVSQNRVVVNRGSSTTTYTATELKAQSSRGVGYVALRSDSYAPAPLVLYDLPPGTVITYYGVSLPSAEADKRRVTLSIDTARPEVPNATLLNDLAKFFYAVPASDPADIETQVFRPPAELAGRVTLSSGYQQPVEAWEYRISSKDGLIVAAQTGQADDPGKLAQAALIKARDGAAVITAVTAQT